MNSRKLPSVLQLALAFSVLLMFAAGPSFANLDYSRRDYTWQIIDGRDNFDELALGMGALDGPIGDQNSVVDTTFEGSIRAGASLTSRYRSDASNIRLDMTYALPAPTNGFNDAVANLSFRFRTEEEVRYELEGMLQSDNAALTGLTYSVSLATVLPSVDPPPFESYVSILSGTGLAGYTLGEPVPSSLNPPRGSLRGTLAGGAVHFLNVTIDAGAHRANQFTSGSGYFQMRTWPVPEPGTALLLGIGLASLSARRPKRSAGLKG